MPGKTGRVLLALAGLSLVLTGCGGSNTAVANPDGSSRNTEMNVVVVSLNTSEKVVCVSKTNAISCDWDNKITDQ